MEIKPDISFWSIEESELFRELQTSSRGLSSAEAKKRKHARRKKLPVAIQRVLEFLSQYKSPLSLLLIFSVALSAYLGDFSESAIIFTILLISGVLSYIQEFKANRSAEKLRRLIGSKARVLRGGSEVDVHMDEVVSGDIVVLEAGDIVPADGRIIEMKDLYVNEAVLTGESFPSEKQMENVEENASLPQRVNSVFKGTSVVSGRGVMLAVYTDKGSAVGGIEQELETTEKYTAFEAGIRNFGFMLMRVALVIAGFILIINIYLGKNPLDSVLFALALSLGLTPEMLPAIVTITLSAGAKRLASKKVIVKRLNSVQNLGAINVLCSDKTGTLTEGEVKIHSVINADGKESDQLKLYAYLNAVFQSGYTNPMDEAIRKQLKRDIDGYEKYDEVPFDFIRKRLSIVTACSGKHLMITKGAFRHVLEVCDKIKLSDDSDAPLDQHREHLMAQYEEFGKKGLRTIGLAFKDVTGDPLINKDDESNMTFLGFVLLFDPPKAGIKEAIEDLKRKNVDLKIITGDNSRVALNLAKQIGIEADKVITGAELRALNDDAVARKVSGVSIFSEAEPSQKEMIVRALQKKGNVVGYLGDGINDAAALKAADVGISVNNAVDVAKESADMILLEKRLQVISEGISEGRKTYLNTLKYIFITVSANFGNMLSMALASVTLSFFPLLASQVLLTNLLTDMPALAIASDNVDKVLLARPLRWNMAIIRRFMFLFGLQSSVFDILTFVVLLRVFHSVPETFRTGWFIESVITEIVILLVIRSHGPAFRSKPAPLLLVISGLTLAITFVLPYLPFAGQIGLVPLPLNIFMTVILIAAVYGGLSELMKSFFFRKFHL